MLFTKEIKLRLLEIYKANKERFEPTSHDANANRLANSAWRDRGACQKQKVCD
jgi:hypothetical protein